MKNVKKFLLCLIIFFENHGNTTQFRKIEVGTLRISEKAKKYVNQVLDSNRLSYGPFLQKFEQEFARLHNAQHAIISNSGTSSLHVALQALKEIHQWSDGDEVIVPAVTFVATSNIVIHNKMKPVFVDVDPHYYEIDSNLIEQKITPRTRAIIVVHLFGHPCDMDSIQALAKHYNLKIIEDSCETMFAHYKGRSVGSLGDIACFSTYVAHLLTTGVGGFALTNNQHYAIKLRSLVNHGRDSIYLTIDDDDNVEGAKLQEIIEKRFSFVSIGHSFRVTELEGALGLAQLEDWEKMIRTRRANGAYLIENLQELSEYIQLPSIRKDSEHSFMMFPMVLKYEPKTKLVNFLEQNGIETRDMLPLINQPIYKQLFKLEKGMYPVADWIHENGFYIGCHQDLTKEDLDYIIENMKSYFVKI